MLITIEAYQVNNQGQRRKEGLSYPSTLPSFVATASLVAATDPLSPNSDKHRIPPYSITT